MTDILERLKGYCKMYSDPNLLGDAADEIEQLRQRLHEVSLSWQEGQAREAKLRDLLARSWTDVVGMGVTKAIVVAALNEPQDDTALKEVILEAKREALMEAAEWFDDGYEYSAANSTAKKLRRMAEELK